MYLRAFAYADTHATDKTQIFEYLSTKTQTTNWFINLSVFVYANPNNKFVCAFVCLRKSARNTKGWSASKVFVMECKTTKLCVYLSTQTRTQHCICLHKTARIRSWS